MALQTNECERYTIDERKEKNLVKDKNLKVGSSISLLRQRGGEIKWGLQYFPLVRLFFNQNSKNKTEQKEQIQVSNSNVNDIQYPTLGIFTQWNVLYVNICHADNRDVLGSDQAHCNLHTAYSVQNPANLFGIIHI